MKPETIRSKDGLLTVGMYPENCRELRFVYNKKYESLYKWPEDSHLLLSFSRIMGSTPKPSIQNWIKKVGKEEAERIIEESKRIGTLMHTYLETSLWKFCNIRYQNLPPIVAPAGKDPQEIKKASSMGSIILQEGLKNKLQEVWGMEAHVYFDHYFRGKIDLVGVYNNKPCIIDFKQTRNPKKREWVEEHFMQLACYGMSHNHLCKTKIEQGIILMCSRDLQYQEFKLEGKEWKHYCHAFLKELKEYVDKEYTITKKRWDSINQTMKELI